MAKVIAGLFAGKIALTYYTDGTGCTLLNGNSTEGHSFASGGDKFYILAKNTHHKGTSCRCCWQWSGHTWDSE
ncbi:hypothetical protein JHK86_021201 [Glycine max]|nr:hypothetical protein JHK86_021201 [Glycine max]